MTTEHAQSVGVDFDHAAATATIRVDNPPVNAMSETVMAGLGQALDAIADDARVRAVVLTGTGAKAFVAGAEISEFERFFEDEAMREASGVRARALFDRLAGLPQPTIAAVQASAVGGGLELALACDLIVADPAARLGCPEVKLGIIPGGGGTQRLPRRVGLGAARNLLLRGKLLRAEDALAIGLVDQVSGAGEALADSRALAAELAALPHRAVRAIKRCIDGGADLPLADALDLERDEILEVMRTEDFREGMTAFVQRRPPQFLHR